MQIKYSYSENKLTIQLAAGNRAPNINMPRLGPIVAPVKLKDAYKHQLLTSSHCIVIEGCSQNTTVLPVYNVKILLAKSIINGNNTTIILPQSMHNSLIILLI